MKNIKLKKVKENYIIGVLLIVISLLFISISSFAFFSYKINGSSTLNFGKVQISSTNSHIIFNKSLNNLMPGDNLLDSANNEKIQYIVDSDSKPIFSRVKFYFSSDSTQSTIQNYILELNSMDENDWKLHSSTINSISYDWEKSDIGNYYYLVERDSKIVRTLKANDIVTFADSLVLPTDLSQDFDNNGNPLQYNLPINLNIVVEAIQSDNYIFSDGTTIPTLENVSYQINDKYSPNLNPTPNNYFMFDNGVLILNDENKNSLPTDIVIPSYINKIKVVSIDDYAFSNATNVKSILIPNTITNIGEGAFASCSSLESILIPSSVETIGGWPFNNCQNLMSINVEPKNNYFKSISNCILSKDGKTLIQGCNNSSIPNNIETISDSAFIWCNKLKSITLPETLKTIDYNAFYNCSTLENVVIPNSVATINSNAFSNCTNLKSINIGDGLTTLNSAFDNCSSLNTIILKSSIIANNIGYFNYLLVNSSTKVVKLPISIINESIENYLKSTNGFNVITSENIDNVIYNVYSKS